MFDGRIFKNMLFGQKFLRQARCDVGMEVGEPIHFNTWSRFLSNNSISNEIKNVDNFGISRSFNFVDAAIASLEGQRHFLV